MASELEPKIDTNAQDDIEHLLYLIGVDGIVSNETDFMSTACKQLFPEKNFLSVAQLIRRLKNG